MKKKLGYGSLSLLLVIIALLWGCTFNGFCLGDQVLALLGMSGWSSGAFRIHYSVFHGILLYIPAYFLGKKFHHHLFAQSGKCISGCLGGCLLIILCAILIFT